MINDKSERHKMAWSKDESNNIYVHGKILHKTQHFNMHYVLCIMSKSTFIQVHTNLTGVGNSSAVKD